MSASVSCSSKTRRASRMRDLPLLLLPRHDLLEHVLEVHVHLLHAEVGEDLHGHSLLLDGHLHHAFFQFPCFEPRLHLVAGALLAFVLFGILRVPVARAGHEQIEEPIGDAFLGLRLDQAALFLAHHADGHLGQVADHAFNVAAVIADLGILGGLDLQERRADRVAAKRRAISVLPTPVGPIMMMFLGVTSLRRSAGNCCRRQRLRMAMATARLAAS